MTRDELIVATRQLIEEGTASRPRRRSRRSRCGSSARTTCWRRRGGAWTATTWPGCMVGKPKAIVRGRPMTADEEAAYVREVADQKTAALRMSLDAVERQGMPFVGETGGSGPGRGRAGARTAVAGAGPDRAPDRTGLPTDPGLAERLEEARRRAAAHLDHDAPRAPAGSDAAMTLAMGGTRTVPDAGPDRPRLHPARRCGWTSTSRASSMATSARPTSRPRWTWSSGRRPPRCATTRSPCEPGSPPRSRSPTGGTGWTSSSSRSRPRPPALAGRRAALPRARRALLRVRAAAPRRPRVRCGRRRDRRAAPRRRAARRPAGRLGRRSSSSRSIGCRRSSTGSSRGTGRAAAACSGCPTARTCGSRSSTDQPWSGYNWFDGGRRSRVDINTDLPVRATDLIHVVAHETYPGHHLEHAWKEADLVDARGRLEASVLLINTPECLISEGLADVGRRVRGPRGRARGPAARDLRPRPGSRSAAIRWRPATPRSGRSR